MLQRCNGEDSMGRPLAVFLAATLLASGAAPLAARAPARLRQQPEGRVSGRVVNARTQVPLSSVRVHVVGTEIGVMTNADGRYELLGLAAGRTLCRRSASATTPRPRPWTYPRAG